MIKQSNYLIELLYQIIDFEDTSIQNLFSLINNKKELKNYLEYKSPIISCMLTADNEKINYTDIINLFINYNCHLSLSDNGKNKLLWLNLLKKYQDIEISENTKLTWQIILDDVSIHEGSILDIKIENGIIKII